MVRAGRSANGASCRNDGAHDDEWVSMTKKNRVAACAAFVCLAFSSLAALAEDRMYSEGAVVNVARIRTANGHFDDYMKYITTTWKQTQEAAKKAGYITDYKVLTAEPRNDNEPDILLVVFYKNWAALDGALDKGDAIANLVEGSIEASAHSFSDRDKIRRTLGSETMQVLNLK
jgi:hypothetical protein